jgi:hypothetical protein
MSNHQFFMAPRSKARNARPSPSSLCVPSTSEEDFDLNIPGTGDSEKDDDNSPVQSAGHTPNMTGHTTKINNPSIFGKDLEDRKTEYDFFFEPKIKDSKARRRCLHCT